MFDRNSRGKTSQIEWLLESNLKSFDSLSDLQRFGFFYIPAVKAIRLQELAKRFKPRLPPDIQNRAFAKNRSCIQILDKTLKWLPKLQVMILHVSLLKRNFQTE